MSSLLFSGGSEESLPTPVIVARFDGECGAGDWIEEGDEIRSDGDGGWVHANGECDRE